MNSSTFDFNILLASGIGFSSSFIIFSWFMFKKKPIKINLCEKNNLCDKNTTFCNCTEGYCGYCGVKICNSNKNTIMIPQPNTLSFKIKKFLLKRKPFKLYSLQFFNKQFYLLFYPVINRIKETFKKQKKKELKENLCKLAKTLWDQGKYTEAAKINLEILNEKKIKNQ
jgi:hypothetical protein